MLRHAPLRRRDDEERGRCVHCSSLAAYLANEEMEEAELLPQPVRGRTRWRTVGKFGVALRENKRAVFALLAVFVFGVLGVAIVTGHPGGKKTVVVHPRARRSYASSTSASASAAAAAASAAEVEVGAEAASDGAPAPEDSLPSSAEEDESVQVYERGGDGVAGRDARDESTAVVRVDDSIEGGGGDDGGDSGDDDRCHADPNAGYDGHAFTWGMAFKVANAAECCDACRAHATICGGGGGGGKRSAASAEPFWRASGQDGDTVCGPDPDPAKGFFCNVWVFCPEETCWSNDVHSHTKGECWLKHQRDPSRPYSPSRGRYPDQHREAHPTSPEVVQWTSGVLVPPGTKVRWRDLFKTIPVLGPHPTRKRVKKNTTFFFKRDLISLAAAPYSSVVPGEPSWGKAVDA